MAFDSHQLVQELLSHDGHAMTPEVARFFVEMKLSEVALARISELGEKATQGALTSEESDELATFVTLGDLLAVLKLRASSTLSERGSAA
ncbi:MAG: hypothetical protein H7144_12415 [Burkholderiales bacterium]|nr:hypothetical protein [Phycisphaerae bacterium]